MARTFRDRVDAGRQLALRLSPYANRTDVIVLGLPRGGVPVAAEIASALHAPLDLFLVRKLGLPGYTELAMGAVAEGNVTVLNKELIDEAGISQAEVDHAIARERQELSRRATLYRGDRPGPAIRDRIVIVVDDGLATGATMEAAVASLRQMSPSKVIAAAPVGANATCSRLARLADEVVCLEMPEPFFAVGQWYQDFSETSDSEVTKLLR